MSTLTRARLALASITIIWGSTFPLGKIVLAYLPPFAYAAIRYSSATLLMLLIYGRTVTTTWRKAWRQGIPIGFCLGLAYLTQTVGIANTSANKAGFYTSISVVLVPLLLAIWFKEKPTLRINLAVCLALVGILLLSDFWSEAMSFNGGDALVIICAFFFALHIILFDRLPEDCPRTTIVTQQFMVSALLSAVIAWGFEPFPSTTPPPHIWGLVIFLTLAATVLAFSVMAWAQRYLSAPDTALILILEPVFAAFFAWQWLGEALGVTAALGAMLILASLWLSSLPEASAKNAA